MSHASSRPEGSRASRLLSRVLVVAGAVAGLSTAWLVSTEAHAETREPGPDQSIVDTEANLVSDVLEPATGLVPEDTPLKPVVGSVTDVLRDTENTTLEPVKQVVTETPEVPEESSTPDHSGHESPQSNLPGQQSAAQPAVPESLSPERLDAAPGVRDSSPSAELRIFEQNSDSRATDEHDEPAPGKPLPHTTHPFVPVPPSGSCGVDNGHGSPTGLGICWHDHARPAVLATDVRHHSGTLALTGVAGPQPGTTPD